MTSALDRKAAWSRYYRGERVRDLKNRRINNNVLEIIGDDDRIMLSIAESIENGTMDMELSGELRSDAAHDFEDEVMAALSVCSEIRISFEKVSYVAGKALQCLLAVQHMADEMDNVRIVIVKPSKTVMERFGDLGFDEILDIEE